MRSAKPWMTSSDTSSQRPSVSDSRAYGAHSTGDGRHHAPLLHVRAPPHQQDHTYLSHVLLNHGEAQDMAYLLGGIALTLCFGALVALLRTRDKERRNDEESELWLGN